VTLETDVNMSIYCVSVINASTVDVHAVICAIRRNENRGRGEWCL